MLFETVKLKLPHENGLNEPCPVAGLSTESSARIKASGKNFVFKLREAIVACSSGADNGSEVGGRLG